MQLLNPAFILQIIFRHNPLGGCIYNGKIGSAIGKQSLTTCLMIQLGRVQNVKMQMIDGREGTEAVETDAECVGGWICRLAATAATIVENFVCGIVNVSPQQSYSQIDCIRCQLLRQTLLRKWYEQTMAKHERADVDQYAMTLLISIL